MEPNSLIESRLADLREASTSFYKARQELLSAAGKALKEINELRENDVDTEDFMDIFSDEIYGTGVKWDGDEVWLASTC